MAPVWRWRWTLSRFQLPYLPTGLAVLGVLALLMASFNLGREVVLSVRGFDRELDIELARHRH